MSFKEVAGQDGAVRILKSAVAAGRLPHALLFHGPDGVGKGRAAMELAKALNCESGGPEPCDSCRSCRKIDRQVHPDVIVLGKDEDRTRIQVDSVRQVTRRLHQYRPFEGKAKVLVLERAEELSAEGENALLKTLEEPPKDTYIVLLTSVPNRLLPTTRSRCQAVAFSRLPMDVVMERALELCKGDRDQAEVMAFLAEGSLARLDELKAMDLKQGWDDAVALVQGSAEPARAMSIASREGRSRESAEAFLDLLEAAANREMSGPGVDDRRLAWRLLEMLEEVKRKNRLLERGVNHRLVLESLLLSMCR